MSISPFNDDTMLRERLAAHHGVREVRDMPDGSVNVLVHRHGASTTMHSSRWEHFLSAEEAARVLGVHL